MTGDDVFVGRDAELATLAGEAAAVVTGGARTVLVEGRPGAGASTLVARFASGQEGFETVAAAASRAEQDFPYALAGQLAARLEPAEPGIFDPDIGIAAVAARLIAALESRERAGPQLLLLDDLQWADAESLAVLRFTLRRLGAERVLAVLVGRRGRGAWDGLAARHDWPDRIVRVDVDELDAGAAVSLVTAVRGGAPDDRTMRHLLSLTGGNPLYLRAVLADTGGGEPLVPPDSVPTLVEAVQGVVASFTADEQRLLAALAVLEAPATAEEIGRLSGVAHATGTVDELLPTGLVRWVGANPRRAEYANEALAELVLAGLTPNQVAALHRDAAAMTNPPRRWRHLVAAAEGPDQDLERALVQAADEEREARRYTAAARCLLWARAVVDGPERSATLLVEAIRLLLAAGGGEEALPYRTDVEALPPSAPRTEARGLLELAEGFVASSRDLLAEARETALADGDREAVARLDVVLAYVSSLLGLGEATMAAAEEALAADPPAWPEAARAFLAIGAALARGPEAGLRVLDDLPEAATDCSAGQMPQLIHRGMLRGLVGRLDAAAADLTVAARRRADSAGYLGAQAHIHLVWCHYLRGDWIAAARDLDLGFAAAEQYGRAFDPAALLSLSAVLRAGRGERDGALADLARAADLGADSDYLGSALRLVLARAAIAHADGAPEEVVEALRMLTPSTTEPDRHRLFAVWWLPSLGDAQVATGRLAAAERTAAELRRYDAEGPNVPVALAWVEGRLLAATRRVSASSPRTTSRSGIAPCCGPRMACTCRPKATRRRPTSCVARQPPSSGSGRCPTAPGSSGRSPTIRRGRGPGGVS